MTVNKTKSTFKYHLNVTVYDCVAICFCSSSSMCQILHDSNQVNTANDIAWNVIMNFIECRFVTKTFFDHFIHRKLFSFCSFSTTLNEMSTKTGWIWKLTLSWAKNVIGSSAPFDGESQEIWWELTDFQSNWWEEKVFGVSVVFPSIETQVNWCSLCYAEENKFFPFAYNQ